MKRRRDAAAENCTDISFDRSGQIIRKRRERANLKRGYGELIREILVLAAAVWILFTQVFTIARQTGIDMFPSVKDGDLVLAYRLESAYEKDEVVVYCVDGETRIGRIAARAGDYVNMDENGTLTVNGTVQSGEILYPTYAKEGIEYPYLVPDDCVFILGDYRTESEDSRDFGPVSLKDVRGKVITILRRRGI